MDYGELSSAYREIEENGWDILAIYSSRSHSPAYPSATDIRLANWPDAYYMYVALMDANNPQVRAFGIVNGEAIEGHIEIIQETISPPRRAAVTREVPRTTPTTTGTGRLSLQRHDTYPREEVVTESLQPKKSWLSNKWTWILAVTALIILSIVLANIGVSGDSTQTQSPTRSLSESGVADTALAELFWIAADAAGINRSLGFERAKSRLADVLFSEYDHRLNQIEGYGVDPFTSWPYCINATTGAMAIASVNLSKSPEEAAPEVDLAIEVIQSLDSDVLAARVEGRGGWSLVESKRKCDQFEAEARAKRGWPPSGR